MRDNDSRAEWGTRFARTVSDELHGGVRSGALTGGEAEQLLARLRVLVDQALELTPRFG